MNALIDPYYYTSLKINPKIDVVPFQGDAPEHEQERTQCADWQGADPTATNLAEELEADQGADNDENSYSDNRAIGYDSETVSKNFDVASFKAKQISNKNGLSQIRAPEHQGLQQLTHSAQVWLEKGDDLGYQGLAPSAERLVGAVRVIGV